MKKFFKYLLTYFLGFLTCIALIVGVGYWAYTSVSISTIEGWTGTTIVDEESIDENAEVNVKNMTISKLISEIGKISSESDTTTLDSLINRYGLKLSSDVLDLIPQKAMGLPLDKLFTEDGKNEILRNTNVEYLYSIIGEDAIAEPLKSTLANKSLDKVFSGDIDYILDGVKLGYVAGVTYEKQGDVYVATYKNPDEPTMVELLEGVSVKELLKVFNEGEDILKVIVDGAGESSLNQLIESISDGESLIGEGAKIKDLYVYNEGTSSYSIDLTALVGQMKLGHIIGYTPIEDGDVIVDWEMTGTQLSSINKAIANIPLTDVVESNFDIMDTLGEFYVGELLDYTPIYDGADIIGWKNGEVEVEEVISKFASAKVSELMDGTFNVDEEIKAIKVCDILDYTSTTYSVYKGGNPMLNGGEPVTYTVWTKGTTEANSIVSAIASKTIGELMGGLSSYKIGTLAGFVEIDSKWYSLEKTTMGSDTIYNASDVKGIIKHFVGLSVDSLSSGSALETAINGILIGEALGYVEKEGVWYVEYVDSTNNTPVEGILKSFVGLKISELKNGDVITDALQHVVVGEEMGYYCEEGVWYTDSTKSEKLTGILASIAGLSVGDLSNRDNLIQIVNDQSVGDMLGYYYDAENDVWCNNATDKTPLVGITKTIAAMKVGDLLTAEESIKDMSFGEVMGYHYDETLGWVDKNNDSHGRVMSLLCSKKIYELESTVDGLTIGDIFSETERTGTILGLLDEETKVTDISAELKTKLNTATLGTYIELGIIDDFSTENKTKLNHYAPGWSGMTIEQFLTAVLDNLPTPIV